MKLVLSHTGSAQLLDESEHPLWSSDTDDDFKDDFGDDFLTEDDVEDIFDYLTENDIVKDEDVENIEIFEDSLEGDAAEEDEEDDDELLS